MPYNIYISSTHEDLRDYRQAVREAVIRMGMFPVMEEDFGPVNLDMASILRQKIEDCDMFIGIYAHQYGRKITRSNGEQTGVIEMEFEWACNKGIQRLLYLIEPQVAWHANFISRGEDYDRLEAFKRRITQETFFNTFNSPGDLQAKVFFGLHQAELQVQKNTG